MSPLPPEVAALVEECEGIDRRWQGREVTPRAVALYQEEVGHFIKKCLNALLVALTPAAPSPPAPVEDDGLDDFCDVAAECNCSHRVCAWLRELQARRRGDPCAR